MALLTAEDVLNKAFSKTKYREGFDQDEVDDFLDEVANSISALTAERDELQARLAQYQAGGVPAAPATTAVAQAPLASAGVAASSADLLAAATDPNPPSATTMLSMAQRLHDDYVQAGEAERDRIIDEGKAKAESIVEQAEQDARTRMAALDSERADLERRIDDLRRFERDYRGHLRNYLENLLGDLEHNGAKGAVDAPGTEPDLDSVPGALGFGIAASESLASDAAEVGAVDPETVDAAPADVDTATIEDDPTAFDGPGFDAPVAAGVTDLDAPVAEAAVFATEVQDAVASQVADPVSPEFPAANPFASNPFAPAPLEAEPAPVERASTGFGFGEASVSPAPAATPFAPEAQAPAPFDAAPYGTTPFGATPFDETPASASPFAAEPFVPASEPEHAYGQPAAPEQPAPLPAFPAPLPPFPDSAIGQPQFPSTLGNGNPFGTTEGQPTRPADAADTSQGVDKPEDEAPRWNF